MHIVLPIFYKNALEGFIVAYYNVLLKSKNFWIDKMNILLEIEEV